MTWHVDDLKISYQNGWEINKIIKQLDDIYRNIKVKRGKIHENIGMKLDYTKSGVVMVSIKPYVEKIITEFLEEIGLVVASMQAVDYLLKVRDKQIAKKLPEEQAVQFHRVVSKSLFICNQARTDI